MTTKTLSLVFLAPLSLLIVLNTGWAVPPIPPIYIDKITSHCTNNTHTVTITMNSTSWESWKKTLPYFHNPPGSASTQRWPSNTNPATFNVLPGPGKFQITRLASSGGSSSAVYPYDGVTCGGPQKKGMTWFHTASNATYGTITVGCGPAGKDRCDPAQGDTPCTQQLPVLCIYKPTPAFSPPVGLPIPNEYNRWSGGVVATTQPRSGTTFADITAVNSYCIDQFGDGWRAAEFHDGMYWNFQAYGGTVSAPTVPSTRFWVNINDQPLGNCWSQ